jgi:hypothetical protein
MRYLITTAGGEPFLTEWFDAENNFTESVGMVVYDLCTFKYTTDGRTWKDINEDNL